MVVQYTFFYLECYSNDYYWKKMFCRYLTVGCVSISYRLCPHCKE
jgi:coproporphyrinogen III oxidase-like Fe-S oxidoreductase